METNIKSTFSDGFNNLLNHFDIKINITNESQSVSDVIEFDGHSGTYGEIKSAIETQFKNFHPSTRPRIIQKDEIDDLILELYECSSYKELLLVSD